MIFLYTVCDVSYTPMVFLLLHDTEAQLRSSVNDKNTIQVDGV